MINLMLRQKGGDYLDADGNIDITNDKMVEVLEYIQGNAGYRRIRDRTGRTAG